jgi:hypothetical protein
MAPAPLYDSFFHIGMLTFLAVVTSRTTTYPTSTQTFANLRSLSALGRGLFFRPPNATRCLLRLVMCRPSARHLSSQHPLANSKTP